jgi:hypothetical protein
MGLLCAVDSVRFVCKQRAPTGQCACGFGVKAHATRKMRATRWSLIFCSTRQHPFHAHFTPKPGRLARSPRSVDRFGFGGLTISPKRSSAKAINIPQSSHSTTACPVFGGRLRCRDCGHFRFKAMEFRNAFARPITFKQPWVLAAVGCPMAYLLLKWLARPNYLEIFHWLGLAFLGVGILCLALNKFHFKNQALEWVSGLLLNWYFATFILSQTVRER